MPYFTNTIQQKQVQVHGKYSARKKALLSLASLSFILLSLVSCRSLSDGQSSTGAIVVQQAPKARLTYVAIGASDTFGIGADDPQSENWPTDLATKLGSGVHLVNLGIPGILLHQALSFELPVALDAHPDLITIWLAVNDITQDVPLASYSHDLDLLLNRLQAAAPHARIVVANVPDLTLLPFFSSYSEYDLQALKTQVLAYNTAIASIIKRHHVLLVDLYQQWQGLKDHPEYISQDGLHPSTLGYAQLAELFYQALQ